MSEQFLVQIFDLLTQDLLTSIRLFERLLKSCDELVEICDGILQLDELLVPGICGQGEVLLI